MMPANGALHDVKMPEPQLVPVNQVFRIQLRNILTGASNGSGVLGSYVQCDPSATATAAFGSGTVFPEWTSWAALFAEVKCLQFEVQVCKTYIDETKGDDLNAMVIASTTSPIAPSITSYQNVAELGDAQLWSWATDQSGMNRFHALRLRQTAWASSSNPNPGSSSGIAAGCPGSILFFANGCPTSTQICFLKVTGTYLLRTRI
jgi:hypothetical protein